MNRYTEVERITNETQIRIELGIDGKGSADVDTGIPFFDHMLTLFAAHGFFDLSLDAKGDLEVDSHHTVEDVGLVLGEALNRALGERKGIRRYGFAVTPMDESLATVAIDLSKRPFLVYNVPAVATAGSHFDIAVAKEFFRAFANNGGMNLHINLSYGENEHHILEAVFKAAARALDQAVSIDDRIADVHSTKGTL